MGDIAQTGEPTTAAAALRTVLATSDLTEDSDAAMRTASILATTGGAAMHVFHCVPRPAFPAWKGIVGAETRARWLEGAKKQLERQLDRALGDRSTAVEQSVGLGTPSREITRIATGISADVIVLGRHRPRAAFDDLLGTTADRVLRTSKTPCLLANRPPSGPIRRILVATDFSEHSRRALEMAVDWFAVSPSARPGNSEAAPTIDVLHVSAFASPLRRPVPVHPLLDAEVEFARRRLAGGAPVAVRSRILAAAIEAEGIARAAEEMEADLIALGTHGYGFLPRTLLGSIASSVARMVDRPLLLVPLHAAEFGDGAHPGSA